MTPYYEQGNTTIYHGDCRDVLADLGKIDLVLTDPPYAIGASRGEWSVTASVAIGLHLAAERVRKADGSLVAFTTTSGRGIEFTQGAVKGLMFNRLLVWHKPGGYSRAASPWRWDAVAILLFGRTPTYRGLDSAVASIEDTRGKAHPAELPNGLADWVYKPFDRNDLVVADPFMGSGRLLEPAVRAGRRVIGIEIEERYCEIAAKRLAQTVMDFGDAA